MRHQFSVLTQAPKQRLDVYLSNLFNDYSRSQLSRFIKQGHVRLNQQPTQAKTPLHHGDEISIEFTEFTSPRQPATAENIALNIIYEDAHVLIVNKPAGLVVHPGAGVQDGTLMNALLHHHNAAAQLPRAGIVHRLDKLTSGLMLVAKSVIAMQRLTQMMAQRQIQRHYLTLCNRVPISGFSVEEPIGRHPQQRTLMSVRAGGRYALTHFNVIQKFRRHCLLKAKLETGRTHQIRVHLSHAGYAVVGDPDYARQTFLAKNMQPALIHALQSFKRQALHAYQLNFNHPMHSQALHFSIPVAQDMQQLLALLQQDTIAND